MTRRSFLSKEDVGDLLDKCETFQQWVMVQDEVEAAHDGSLPQWFTSDEFKGKLNALSMRRAQERPHLARQFLHYL